ncbi:MAG: hypothetical protein RMK99_03110 [Anaerolineales bacterium]|nr:hypothetical protein [Anaerolineales bacterium]
MRLPLGVIITAALLVSTLIACATIRATIPADYTPEHQASPRSALTQGTAELTSVFPDAVATSTTTATAETSPAQRPSGEYASLFPSVSADGRFVVFTTNSPAILGEGAPSCNTGEEEFRLCFQIVRYDVRSGEFRVVSASASGELANRDSHLTRRAVSADGERVVFTSSADNLTENTHPDSHIFLNDLKANKIYNLTNPVMPALAGASQHASLSADGGYVVFQSTARYLSNAQAQDTWNVYLYEVSTGAYTLVSQGSRKPDDFGYSLEPAISSNGRWVAFWSWAGLVEADDSPCAKTGEVLEPCGDVYRYDVQTGGFARFVVGEGLGKGSGDLGETFISSSGRWILAGDLLIDMEQNVSANLQVTLGQTTCGAVLSQSADAILCRSHTAAKI